LVGLFFGVAIGAVLPGAHVHALNAAGAFNGTPINGVQNFVDKLRGSTSLRSTTAREWGLG
jgi:hypothetical protein